MEAHIPFMDPLIDSLLNVMDPIIHSCLRLHETFYRFHGSLQIPPDLFQGSPYRLHGPFLWISWILVEVHLSDSMDFHIDFMHALKDFPYSFHESLHEFA